MRLVAGVTTRCFPTTEALGSPPRYAEVKVKARQSAASTPPPCAERAARRGRTFIANGRDLVRPHQQAVRLSWNAPLVTSNGNNFGVCAPIP